MSILRRENETESEHDSGLPILNIRDSQSFLSQPEPNNNGSENQNVASIRYPNDDNRILVSVTHPETSNGTENNNEHVLTDNGEQVGTEETTVVKPEEAQTGQGRATPLVVKGKARPCPCVMCEQKGQGIKRSRGNNWRSFIDLERKSAELKKTKKKKKVVEKRKVVKKKKQKCIKRRR